MTRGRPPKERYARLMGGFWRNAKARRLSLEARGLLATAWSYAADQKTDGRVPIELLEAWARKRYPQLMAELAGFLVVSPGEIDAVAHDWTDVNISVEEWERRKEIDRNRKRDSNDFPTGNDPDIPPDIPPGKSLDFQAESLDEDEDDSKKKIPKGILSAKSRGPVLLVFEHWREKLGKRSSTKLDAKRRRRIVWALKTYGLDACKRCIDGYATSEYHLGENDSGTRYDDLELFFRDAKHFESGLAHAEKLDAKDTAKRRAAEREQRERKRERERQREIEARAVAPGELKKLLGPYVREAAE